MDIREIVAKMIPRRRTDYSPSVSKEEGNQWVKMDVPFVTQWVDAVRSDIVPPKLFEKLVQDSHLAAIDGDLVEHKYVRTQSIRRKTLDHTGLIPNLLDVAETPEQILKILIDIVERNLKSLKEDRLFNKNNLQGFLAEKPLATWEFKGGQNIEDFVNGTIFSDLLHSGIVRDCKALRRKESNAFYENTKELFRRYQQPNGEITYKPCYVTERKPPKEVITKLVYVEQHIHIFPIPHSVEVDRRTPEVLTKRHEPSPDIENPIWILHNSGKAGHPLAVVIAESLKRFYHIPDRSAHINARTDALGDWIRSRQ